MGLKDVSVQGFFLQAYPLLFVQLHFVLTEHCKRCNCACIIYEASVWAMYGLRQEASQAASYNTMQTAQGVWLVPDATS